MACQPSICAPDPTSISLLQGFSSAVISFSPALLIPSPQPCHSHVLGYAFLKTYTSSLILNPPIANIANTLSLTPTAQENFSKIFSPSYSLSFHSFFNHSGFLHNGIKTVLYMAANKPSSGQIQAHLSSLLLAS